MLYRDFGKTGLRISTLGFGAMRLPIDLVAAKEAGVEPDLETAAALLEYGFRQGINYVDTAYGYCGGQSERAVGLALAQGWRDKIMLSDKLPLWHVNGRDDFFRLLEEQLEKLGTDHIDFYHFHSVTADFFHQKILKFKLLDEAAKALDQKIIRHLSFSFHDSSEVMREVIDTQAFSSVLCQYNLLDRRLADGIDYAHRQGLGVVIMGPVGGGRLAYSEGVFETLGSNWNTPELALAFVLDNPAVSCALSGMSDTRMVDGNARVANTPDPLAAKDRLAVEQLLERCRELQNLYCTGCEYCLPCPQQVLIPHCLQSLIYRKVYQFGQSADNFYHLIGDPFHPGKTAAACNNCGRCETKCPQKLPIRQHLAAVREIFG